MKINAEIFLESLSQKKFTEGVFLISGNEPSLINHLESSIIKNIGLSNDYEIIHFDFKKKNDVNLKNLINHQSLFGKQNIIKINNPGDALLQELEIINFDCCVVIIKGENISNNSKLKKYFNLHKQYYSILCYDITQRFKKDLIDKFINKQKIKLSPEAYWFLIENTSNVYQALENELEKISLYGKTAVAIDELRKILFCSNKMQLDELFFQCFVGDNNLIIKKTESTVLSSVDAYRFLNVVKKFSTILAKTSENKNKENIARLVELYLPKYLFRQKKIFEKAITKTNIKKIIIVNNLIEKTELILRKNDSLFLIIVQRFLLNCAKTLK